MVVTKLSALLKGVRPSEENMLLKFNQCQKSRKTPCIIYVYLESLIKKSVCKNILEKSSTIKVGEHIL